MAAPSPAIKKRNYDAFRPSDLVLEPIRSAHVTLDTWWLKGTKILAFSTLRSSWEYLEAY